MTDRIAYLESQIKEQKESVKEAIQEKESFEDLIDGVEKISLGFEKIAKFLKTQRKSTEYRLSYSKQRLLDLEADLEYNLKENRND